MIKVGDIGFEDSVKLPLSEHQQVIKTFPSDTAQETFASYPILETWTHLRPQFRIIQIIVQIEVSIN